MLKKFLFIISFLLFNSSNIVANSDVTEQELITALNSGVEATKKFLEKVPVYRLYDYDKTILHYAVELDKYTVVEFLVSKNIELSRKGGIYYGTALQDAIFYQNFRMAKLLINSGTPLDIKNIDGETALHIATKNGYMDIVELLVAKGASKNVYNAKGDTPYDLIPKFMRDSIKRAKAILKPDPNAEIDMSQQGATGEFALDKMDYGQAEFTLDQMNFEESSGSDVETRTKGMQTTIVDEDTTVTKDSHIGDKVQSN